ncbi:hypothetical protein [Sulfurimonas microaerophilic]|uniref:hypothetical protein n=1 Tax=Sulfurimonas microaerophilic TaxID=3058392 RepID=UPI002714798C|nr:hypothetical protein [Sulfurimonas sp. hsl 1-7]
MKYFGFAINILLLTFLMTFTACDEESLIVDNNISAVSEEQVVLKAKGSAAYSWKQVSGIQVLLVNSHSKHAKFIAPVVASEEILTFELEAIKDDKVVKAQATVTVRPKVVDQLKEKTTLKLTLDNTSLNVDTNTTLHVTLKHGNNKERDVTEQVELIVSDNDAVQITGNILQTKKETNIILQAKYKKFTSNSVSLEIYKVINGHRLPPEPDETLNNSTLLGIDTNNNGVRDDVERWIFAEYDHPIVQAVAMQNARAFQIILVDPSKARETVKFMHNQTDCELYYQRLAEDYNETLVISRSTNLYKESRPLILNTKERNRAYYEYNLALSGGVYPGRPWDTFKNSCDFNETKVLSGEWE